MRQPDNRALQRLVPLTNLDELQVADGYTDIRGFAAYTEDGRRVGEVSQLLVEPDELRVAAVAVDTDATLVHGNQVPNARVPIEFVEIDTPNRRVFILGDGAEHLRLPGSAASEAPPASHSESGEEERILLLSEELELRKQRVDAGEVDIHKRVETEQIRRSVPVTREEVTVERRPLEPGASLEVRDEGNEIHIPLVEEELVIEKRRVAKEEIVIRKRQVQEEQIVETDLRRETVDVRGDRPNNSSGSSAV